MRNRVNNIHGIILLDKPAEMTSNAALQALKRLLNVKKAGHTGSLDPIATGMLPICIGEATKFSQYLLESDKYYQVVAKLGVQTTTGDSEGEILATFPIVDITEEKIRQVLAKFLGITEQTPPMYSALKYKGKPLYELARQGIEVPRQPRSIQIHSIQFDAMDADSFSFTVHCTKGTYVRTLVEDMGKILGCGAHVCQLRRLAVAPFQNTTMHSLDDLHDFHKQAGVDKLRELVLPMEAAVKSFPAVKLATASAFYLRMGQAIRVAHLPTCKYIRLLTESGQFLGIGEVLPDGRVKPQRLLSS